MNEERLSLRFDSLRLLRNSINYYGRKVLIEDAKISIDEAQELIEQIRMMLKNP